MRHPKRCIAGVCWKFHVVTVPQFQVVASIALHVAAMPEVLSPLAVADSSLAVVRVQLVASLVQISKAVDSGFLARYPLADVTQIAHG